MRKVSFSLTLSRFALSLASLSLTLLSSLSKRGEGKNQLDMMSPSSPSASSASEDDDSSPRKRRAPSARVAAAAASAAAAAAATSGGGGGGGGAGGGGGQATSPLPMAPASSSPNRRRAAPPPVNHLPPPPPPLDGIRQFATFDAYTQATPQFARELGEAMSRATWASDGAEPADVAAVVPAGTAVSILDALAERLAGDATVVDVSFVVAAVGRVQSSREKACARAREREREKRKREGKRADGDDDEKRTN